MNQIKTLISTSLTSSRLCKSTLKRENDILRIVSQKKYEAEFAVPIFLSVFSSSEMS